MASPSQVGKYGAPYILDAADEEITSSVFVREIWWQSDSPGEADDLVVTDCQATPLTLIDDQAGSQSPILKRYPIWQNLDQGVSIGTIDSGQVFVWVGRPSY